MNQKLFEFIKKSPTAFHTVKTVSEKLINEGFEKLSENQIWNLEKGKKYFVTRNSSSIIAFSIGKDMTRLSFRIAASHGDSPCFKLKENSAIKIRDKYTKLDTEGYGGMICYSWLDRPLSVADRVVVRKKSDTESGYATEIVEEFVDIDHDMLIIPSLAVHMNREVNKGKEFNKQTDMLPLLTDNADGDIMDIIAKKLGIEKDDILGHDLFVYNRMSGTVWGEGEKFISAPRLDDLMCAYSSLEAFVQAKCETHINVYACFDNEEVGSSTRQGAASTFLYDTFDRICDGLNFTKQEYHMAIADSMMLSIDNGHAVHPNFPEKSDPVNQVYMNGGIVIKSNASQKYTTDAIGTAVCKQLCMENNIPFQFFANKSDEPGGSTLGNISTCNVPVCTVDIGLAQLAMHSSYETAGARDCEYMYRFTQIFYSAEDLFNYGRKG